MGRLGYKKSRNGCQKCKTRRVKCDEKVPCSACNKHGVPCSLEYRTFCISPPLATSAEPGIQKQKRKPRRSSPLNEPDLSIPIPSSAPSQLPPIAPDPWIEDLELMYHYISHTHTTFPMTPSAHLVFRDIIPQVSFRFPYLLHQILALSAFHLAHLHPSKGQAYRLRGAQHQTKSISGMREALGEFTEENAYALFCTSACLMGSVFASKSYGDDTCEQIFPLDGMLEVAGLLKGTTAIQTRALEVLKENPANNLFGFELDGNTLETPTLRDCSVELTSLKESISQNIEIDIGAKETVLEAANDMLRAMSHPRTPRVVPTTELTVVFTWPAQVSDGYVALVRDRHPAALSIFLFYCVMLRSMEDRFWLLKGWGTSLAATISNILVESPWAEWKAWPLHKIENLL